MKKLKWEYNGKYYLETNVVKVKELPIEAVFEKYSPYIIDLTFSKYGFEKKCEQVTG